MSKKPVQVVEEPVTDHDSQSGSLKLGKRAAIDNTRPQEDSHLEDTERAELGKAMRESLTENPSTPGGQASFAEQMQAAVVCDSQGLIPSICKSIFN